MLSSLASAGIGREAVLAAVPADLSADGRFAERWLVVCRDRLAVIEPSAAGDSAFRAGLQEPFTGLTALDYRSMVGGGLLLARRGESVQRELVRCSRAADRAIQGVLGKLRAHLWPEQPGDKDKDKGKEEKPKEPPREALPELSAEAARVFLGQLDELRVQLYCPKCGVPFKEDSQVCPQCVNTGRTLVRILGFAGRYRPQLVLLIGLMVVTILARLAPPYIQGRIFDVALVPPAGQAMPTDRRVSYLLWAVGVLVISSLLAVALRVWAGRIGVVVGSAISRDVRGRVFLHLQRLSLGYFDRHKTGALMTRVNNDTRQLQGFLVDGVQFTLVSILECTLITAILFWLNWRLALLVMIPAPAVVVFTKLIWRRIMTRFRRLWEAASRLSAILNDSLRGVRVVKAFGQERQEIDRFERGSENSYRAEVAAEMTWITLTPLLNLIMGCGLYLVLALGGSSLVTGSGAFGELTPGTLVQFIQYLPMLYMPLQAMTRLNDWLTRSMTAAERIFEILDTEPEVAEHPEAVPAPRLAGKIEIRNVTFGYEKHTPVLKRATLDIAAGEMIGLVGASGAGKTTTINLITRLYDVDQGEILIDGQDIRKIRVADLRRQVGVVLQETFLFSGTIAENIAYAKPEAPREEVIAAARLANAHGFIMDRPDGYDSEVEEGGGNFSGGEKQRLAIARAILHDPRILILDEATSSVDTKTEQQIQEAIARLTAGRTTFAIAHRLSTLRGASRLVVLDKGEIKDVGTHEELSSREGIYRDLVKAHAEMCSVMAVEG